MPDLSIFGAAEPYHILTYGLLFGTQLFHSFLSGPLAFRALPRPQFAVLQSAIFPVYFGLQTVLPGLLALTYPTKTTGMAGIRGTGTLTGEGSRRELLALGLVSVMGLVNWAVVGPATTKVMRDRKGQEHRDGKKSYDKGPQSKEMVRLNRKFGRIHGVSSLVNLGAVLVTGWYGFLLAERM